MKNRFFAGLLGLALAAGAQAQVTVTAPWIRATVPQAGATGAFMQLQSARDARLVAVRSAVAGLAELHEMKMEGQMMRMQAVPAIELAAGKTVNLAAGGYHIMLMDLKRQLKEGEQVPLTLIVEDGDRRRQSIELSVPVKPLTYGPRH